MINQKKIAVIIPCFKVKDYIANVISTLPDFVDFIIAVDDKCPQHTGEFILKNINNPKVTVVFHDFNKGVGGAVVSGYKKALELQADILAKVDGDGQMDPTILTNFIKPILKEEADYTKGNRFFWPESLQTMPFVRKMGNAGLSFINKLSSGYWDIMDPTNGYTAISANVVKRLGIHKLSERYFFESDMLFRLGIIRAVVQDVPMNAVYANEISNLSVSNSFFTFAKNNTTRAFKRLMYLYFIRDFNQGSLSLLFSIPLLSFAIVFGAWKWFLAFQTNIPTPLGTIFLVVLPFLLGFQLLLNFLSYDVNNLPKQPLLNRV